jgi:hypothetical protein
MVKLGPPIQPVGTNRQGQQKSEEKNAKPLGQKLANFDFYHG